MLVNYKFKTGTPEMKRRYGINTHMHGEYQADIEDFKKLFKMITATDPLGSGDVQEIWLTKQNGEKWHWVQGRGWIRI